jgi:ethanolamine transporter EutH
MNKTSLSARKKLAQQAYRRDLKWQIIAPMVVVLILVIAASVAVAVAPAASASRWADVSTIWLLIPLMIFAFVALIIVIGLIYAMTKLLQITPVYTEKLYLLVRLLGLKAEKIADASTKPIFFVEGVAASVQQVIKNMGVRHERN